MASKTAQKSAVVAPKPGRPKLTAAEAIHEIRNLRAGRGAVQNMEYVDLLLVAYDDACSAALAAMAERDAAEREAATLRESNALLSARLREAESNLPEGIISGE